MSDKRSRTHWQQAVSYWYILYAGPLVSEKGRMRARGNGKAIISHGHEDNERGYNAYIDGLVRLVQAPSHREMRLRKGQKLYPVPRVEDAKYNQAAIDDVLGFLAGQPFGVTYEGRAIASEPFETEIQHDLIARLDDDPWPD